MSQRLVQDALAVTRQRQLTDEEVQDIVGAMVTGNTETLITVTYQDGDGTIDFVVDGDLANYTNTNGWISDITGEDLSSLSDVTITSIGTGEILQWDGSAWINRTLAEAGIAADDHTHELDELDATAITDGYVLTADGAGGAAWEAPTSGITDTDDVSEGTTNLYYTEKRARDEAFAASFLLGGM